MLTFSVGNSVGTWSARAMVGLVAVVLVFGCGSAALSLEINCTFNLEVSKEDTRKLGDRGYRVRKAGTVEVLEQRTADGSWMALGNVVYQNAGDFALYLHIPETGPDDFIAAVRVLTVNRDGRASLLQHSPRGYFYRDAWTTYGECWPA